MEVKLLVGRSGGRVSQSAGETVTVSDAEGRRMIEAGQAVAVGSPKKETATKKATAEKAVKD